MRAGVVVEEVLDVETAIQIASPADELVIRSDIVAVLSELLLEEEEEEEVVLLDGREDVEVVDEDKSEHHGKLVDDGEERAGKAGAITSTRSPESRIGTYSFIVGGGGVRKRTSFVSTVMEEQAKGWDETHLLNVPI